MTSLKLSAEVQSILEQRVFIETRTTEGEKIEVEARLGVKPGKSGTDYLSWLNAYKFVRGMPGRRTHSKYTNTIISDSTVSFRERAGNWIVKKEIRSSIVSDNWVKIALSTEAPTVEPTASSRARTIVRHIARHSFYIDVCRVDFSKTYTDGELTCEIEVEYLAPPREYNTRARYTAYLKVLEERTFSGRYNEYLLSLDAANMKLFVDLILAITSSMFSTPLPFTYQDLITVSAICNAVLGKSYEGNLIDKPAYIDRRYLSEAKALDISNLTYEFLFGRGITWTATLKVDGERRVLVVCDKGTWLLFPPLQAAFYSLTDSHASTRITIADVELYRGELWLIDALWVDGVDVRHATHVSRYAEFMRWYPTIPKDLFTGLPLREKKHNVVTGANFFRGVTDTWMSRHGIDCPVDGIILTPNVRYEDTTIRQNRIIFKWKPEITIDLVTIRDKRGKLVLMAATDKGVLEPFVGNEQSRLEQIDMGSIPYNRGAVVEFLCENRRLVALRERPEKPGPNDSMHALDAWLKSTVDTLRIDESTLLGESNVLMRKYHNRIKSDLIMRSVADLPKESELYLLDIGSGRGGDLAKWKKAGFTKMILVEPNEKNIRDLEARLSTEDADFQNRVIICHAQGQDSATIKAVATQNGISKVHVVSMMDSLTYFFDKDRKALAGLAKTVNALLPDGGIFIWKSMDGAAVKTAFNSVGEDTLTYGDSKIRLEPGNTVRVDIPPNQLNVIENLTDMLALKTALNLSGEAQIAQGEAMLSDTFKPLSRLFSYGMFTKGQKLEPTREMSTVLQFWKLKPLTSNQRSYKSAIEAIEGTFSFQTHIALISSYMEVARLPDQEYGAVGTEPMYFKFETAYRGYFSSLFLERSKTDTEVLELNILRDAVIRDPDINIMHASLAFASLLRLDVFIINSEMQLYATNAIEGKTDNPACVVVCNGEEDYSFRLFSNKMPLALSTDPELKDYPRLPSSDFHETSLASLQGDVGKLLTTNKRPATNILNRLAHIDYAPGDIRLRSLANKLLNTASGSCTEADLKSCNIGGDASKLIARVNYFMKGLRDN